LYRNFGNYPTIAGFSILRSGLQGRPDQDLSHGANLILVVISVTKVYYTIKEKKSLVRASAATIGYLV
jgi:hypothetical protein